MTAVDPRLRFRVYIDGKVADEVWLNADDPVDHQRVIDVRRKHMRMTDEAERAGKAWLAEVYDPAEPVRSRAYTRFGTDVAGMIDPLLGRT